MVKELSPQERYKLKNNFKSFSFQVSGKTENDILEKLNSLKKFGVSKYIKDLIRKDINNEEN